MYWKTMILDVPIPSPSFNPPPVPIVLGLVWFRSLVDPGRTHLHTTAVALSFRPQLCTLYVCLQYRRV